MATAETTKAISLVVELGRIARKGIGIHEEAVLTTNDLDLGVVWITDVGEKAWEKTSNVAKAQEAASKATDVAKKLNAASVVSLWARDGDRKSTVGGDVVKFVDIKVEIECVFAGGVVGAIASEIDNSRRIAQNATVAAG